MALMPVADALEQVLAGVVPLGREDVGLRFAAKRTLAQPMTALITSPPFDASAMDGYAVRVSDCLTPNARLTVIGRSAAGRPFHGTLEPGQAVRIFTGAAVPPGADCVVIQENTTREGATVIVTDSATVGLNIRLRGQDFVEGANILASGHPITARDILLAASAGHATLPVYKRPGIAILATGDELVEPGEPLGDGEIIASNSYAIAAMVEAAGAAARLIGIADDTMESLSGKLRDSESADILVISGGASVGDHDLVRPALEAAGVTLAVHKVAMRPGKPMFFGTRIVDGKTQRIVGLPGNPVSAIIVARVFLIPLIAKMLGHCDTMPTLAAKLATPLAANGPRQHFMRAILDTTTLPARVSPLESQDSSMTSILARANALIVVPPDAPAMPAGTDVPVIRLDF